MKQQVVVNLFFLWLDFKVVELKFLVAVNNILERVIVTTKRMNVMRISNRRASKHPIRNICLCVCLFLYWGEGKSLSVNLFPRKNVCTVVVRLGRADR